MIKNIQKTKDATRKDHSNDVDVTRKHALPNIEVIGDSHLSAINPKGLSNKNNVVVRNHPGSTTEDIKSHIIPSLKKNRDLIIIHTGTNDITNKVETILNLQSIVNTIKKKSANTKICISSLFVHKDKKGIEIKVSELNRQLKTFREENLIHFLLNENKQKGIKVIRFKSYKFYETFLLIYLQYSQYANFSQTE